MTAHMHEALECRRQARSGSGCTIIGLGMLRAVSGVAELAMVGAQNCKEVRRRQGSGSDGELGTRSGRKKTRW